MLEEKMAKKEKKIYTDGYMGLTLYKAINGIKMLLSWQIFLFFGEGIFTFFLMVIFTFLFTISMIIFYDLNKMDFLLIEERKIIESKKKKTSSLKLLLFVIMTAYDSFLIVLWYREGSYSWDNIPNLKIYLYFICSTFATNVIGYLILTILF